MQFLFYAACVLFSAPAGGPSGGTAFALGAIEPALDALQNRDEAAVLLVEVSADWCLPCNQLASEVLDTPASLDVVGRDLAVRVDFESDEGQAIKRRFGVLALPTLLVVHRDGYELGRVEGYPGRGEWVEAVRDARAGRAGIDALARASRREPRNMGLALELAQAKLVRGDTKSALKALDKLIAAVPFPEKRKPPKTEAKRLAFEQAVMVGAHAARVKGRWLLRAQENGPKALDHFASVAQRFAGTPHRAHFLYWEANAFEHLTRRDEALAVFGRWAAEDGQAKAALAAKAEFMVHHGYDGAVAVVRELHFATPSASTHYLLSRALARVGELALAHEHAKSAADLEPQTALYANHRARLVTP